MLLLVDDERSPDESLRRALVMAGYEAQPVQDADRARELVSRALAAGSILDVRKSGADTIRQELSFAGLRLDPVRGGACFEDRFVELTRTEYQLLGLLMLNPRRVLSHAVIYQRVWGYDFGAASNALRVYIGYLRRKLRELASPVAIRTVRGVGYALRDG